MSNQTKDFAVKITVKNNRIIQAMKRAGILTFAELARLSAMGQTRLGQIISFKMSPLIRGDWSNYAYNISSALHCEPEELWPNHIKHLHSRKGFAELTLNADELQNISAPSNIQIDNEELNKLILKLPLREQKAVNGVFLEEKTLDQVAIGFGLDGRDNTRERPRQVLAKALRRIKHPNYLNRRTIDDFIK
jgi:lambda repressor-like predicted transcriptional regulator